ncbi:unnamed protein product, partial [Discosporangium mesarthrocarpum]
MTEENSYPLRLDGMSMVEKGPFRGHWWANPSVGHLRELMHHVLHHPAEARQRGVVARKDMVERFSTARMTKLLLAHLHRI